MATLVALLLGSGVLLGMAALTVDVGQLYAERRQLQNGADAAALAVAMDCAVNPTCDTSTTGQARNLAGGNANDAVSAVATVCGAGKTSLAGCPAPTGPTLTRCPAPPTATTGWVEVRTETETADGQSLLPPVFARALAGNADYDGTSVGVCARAAWGPPAALNNLLPVTFSLCEWENAVLNPDEPVYPSAEIRLTLHDPAGKAKDAVPCDPSPPGGDLPGGFGWLDGDSGCSADITVEETVSADTGVAVPKDCKDVLPDLVDTVIHIPIYDHLGGTGTGATYDIAGFAAFHLTGYSLPGNSDTDHVGYSPLCKGEDKCIYGWFTKALAPGGEMPDGGSGKGSYVVALTG